MTELKTMHEKIANTDTNPEKEKQAQDYFMILYSIRCTGNVNITFMRCKEQHNNC